MPWKNIHLLSYNRKFHRTPLCLHIPSLRFHAPPNSWTSAYFTNYSYHRFRPPLPTHPQPPSLIFYPTIYTLSSHLSLNSLLAFAYWGTFSISPSLSYHYPISWRYGYGWFKIFHSLWLHLWLARLSLAIFSRRPLWHNRWCLDHA